jgi:hypothetical protein
MRCTRHKGRRHSHSRTRGQQTPSEGVLRMLILKQVRNWSYETLERADCASISRPWRIVFAARYGKPRRASHAHRRASTALSSGNSGCRQTPSAFLAAAGISSACSRLREPELRSESFDGAVHFHRAGVWTTGCSMFAAPSHAPASSHV